MGDPLLLDKDEPYLFLDNLSLLSYVLTLALTPSLVKYPKPIGVSRFVLLYLLTKQTLHHAPSLVKSKPCDMRHTRTSRALGTYRTIRT